MKKAESKTADRDEAASKVKKTRRKAKKEEKKPQEDSLSGCMARLLQMPTGSGEQKEALLALGFREEEINQTMLLAQAVLSKAVEKGDISAYKEIKTLMEEENSGNGQLERLVRGLTEALREEEESQTEQEEKKGTADVPE